MSVQPTSAPTWHRLSPRMLAIHPIIELGRALPALVGVFFAGHAGGHGLLTSLAVAVAVVAVSITRWFTTRLRITDEQVQLRHGLLRRRTVATRRDRIRTVDVTAHLLHRVLGLSRVVVGTGTSDRKNESRIVLDGLTAVGAESLRRELLHRTPVAMTNQGSEPADELARLERSWIALAPFTLSGVVTGLLVWGFAWRVEGESGVDLLHSGPLRAVGHGLDAAPTALAVVVVGAAILVFVTVTSVIGYVLAFWNFRLVRHDGGAVQVTRGLLTTRATTIERRRLVGIELSRPLLLRAVGGARTLSIATGLRVGRGAEKGGEVLLPPAPVDRARAAAARVLNGATALTVDLVSHGLRARRRRYVRALSGGAVLVTAAGVGWQTGGSLWPVPVAVVLLATSVPLAADRAAALGHAHVDGALVTRSGSLIRRRVVLADHAVIGWTLHASLFQRRAGLSTLTATTAAGRQGYRVLDVETPVAIALADAVTPELLSQFRRRPAPAPRATMR
ncbi:PH domain-containing protein [uncultured Jatrophihabitans sp.]|uniref:PH domain-containing protein n=1 Tax=uncultured Jatrophihabitans sp. TaxID=1610747 RepID=UPI0035CBED01